MSQQEFLESPRHYKETNIYEAKASIERPEEYGAWEQNNEFVDRHLRGEKVQPQPGTKSAAWSLIPLLVLLFLIGGGAFGLTAAFHSLNLAPPHWDDDDFAPSHEWHHHHHPPHCQIISDSDHQFVPGASEDDDSDHIIIVQGQYTCDQH